MRIEPESPRSDDIVQLLNEHLQDMYATSPAESVHALNIDDLDQPSITFWAARGADDGILLGVGALLVHPDGTGEVKSMRTAKLSRGRGVAGAILEKIIQTARAEGLTELNLETGAEPYFAAAWSLYERYGFSRRGPFADYWDDPLSIYYGLPLA